MYPAYGANQDSQPGGVDERHAAQVMTNRLAEVIGSMAVRNWLALNAPSSPTGRATVTPASVWVWTSNGSPITTPIVPSPPTSR